ncbi:MAG: exodeoxyribonuclease III [Bdellovibrionales bacterium]|nr:exodeoxyribonuclease III [Bdellovibrionales bacterium]
MKIYSWNVNGYRAICGKGFDKWFDGVDADVIGLQEVKAHKEAVDPKLLEKKGYELFWHAAKKPGYSGVATWSRVELLSYQAGIGIPKFDDEGRVQILEFKNYYLLNCYFPNSQPERARLKYKLEFNEAILDFCKKAHKKGKAVIVQGDLNVAHTEMDIKNAKSNVDSPGFYIEERDWMSKFLSKGMRDVFREKNPTEPHHYTWWSYRANARANNVGWRIDYHVLSESIADRVKSIGHQPKVFGSDHCPVYIEMKS